MGIKKALVITYMWPPKGGVGVMRAIKFAKYLPKFGWSPVVVTADDSAPAIGYGNEDINLNPSPKVIKTSYRKKLGILPDRIRENVLFPDIYSGWYRNAAEDILKIAEEEHCDVIFSTSPPETAHIIARYIKKKTHLPWVADLRDLWSEDIFRHRSVFARLISQRIEKETLADADRVVTVSEGWRDALAGTAGIDKGKISVITNGFDAEDFNITVFSPMKFTIAYTGKLHNEYQNPEPFFQALKRAVDEHAIDKNKVVVRFHVFGHEKADIAGLTRRYGLEGVVENCGRVSYPEAIRALLSAHVLLFVGWTGEAGRSWNSAKIFDYIGAGKPILFMGDKSSSVARLIRSLERGTVTQNTDEVHDAITGYYEEFFANHCVKLKNSREHGVETFTRLQNTKELASLFDAVCCSQKNGSRSY